MLDSVKPLQFHKDRSLPRVVLCLFFLVVAPFTGCNPAQIGKYRLEKIEGELVILPPTYWNHSHNKKIKVHLPIPTATDRPQKDRCSVASGLFHLSVVKGSSSEWIGTLPSLHEWQESVASGSFHQEFEGFLDQIGKLADAGCLPADRAALVAQAVRESVPIRAHETHYYRYDYRLGTGSIDLGPGMRLKIERAEFDPFGKFQDTSTVYYRITRDSRGAIRFGLEEAHPKRAVGASLLDRTLAARDTGMFYCRLFFPGKLVPPNLNYAAMVIGTRSRKHLEEVTRTIQTRPESGCSASAEKEIDCTLFQGSVSVSGEIGVTVNGSRVFVGPEETLRDLLSQMNRTACQRDLRSLRIEREFLNKLTPVKFDSASDSILDLILLGGDRVSCAGG